LALGFEKTSALYLFLANSQQLNTNSFLKSESRHNNRPIQVIQMAQAI
jgi:hypothetical protein